MAAVTLLCLMIYLALNKVADKFNRAADHIDGIKSILTGVAAQTSQ